MIFDLLSEENMLFCKNLGESCRFMKQNASAVIYGNKERARIDPVIRQELEAEGIAVIEITYSHLSGHEAMLI